MDQGSSRHSFDLMEKRRKIEGKDKSLRPKIMAMNEAIAKFVRDGDHVAIGGCLYSRTPTATIHEIIRRNIKDLTISRSLMGMEADLLIGASALKKVVTSWWSVGYSWGISKIMRESVEKGKIMYEEWSHLSIGLRYRAAAMGASFLPTFSILGSDLERVEGVVEMRCPYTNEKVVLVPALYPDVGIIHLHRADEFGNAQIDGYEFMDLDIARAAERVIVTAEEIVDSEELMKRPDLTRIPFFCVDAVVKEPYGAYPSECWNLYDADFGHFAEFSQEVNSKGFDGLNAYQARYIYDCSSFERFLEKIGTDRLSELRRGMQDARR